MRDFRRPDFMKAAVEGKKGHLAFVEILIAFVMFGSSTIMMAFMVTPFLMPYILKSEAFKTFMATGDQMTYMQQVQQLANNIPASIMIAMLIVQILMIAMVIVYCRFIEKRKVFTMGFVKKAGLRSYVIGAAGGFLTMALVWGVNVLTGAISMGSGMKETSVSVIIGFFIGYLIQGMAEEVLCRGYLFVSLSRRYSVVYSAVVSAMFFAVLHTANTGVTLLSLINVFLFGILAALLMIKFENIWVAAGFHSIWNFVQGNVFGIRVSGNRTQPAIIKSTSIQGMEIVNGGNFGVEGGIAVSVVLVACIIVVFKMLQREKKIVKYELGDVIEKMKNQFSLDDEETSGEPPLGHQSPDQQSQPVMHGPEVQLENSTQVVNIDTIKANGNVEIPEDTLYDSNYFKD